MVIKSRLFQLLVMVLLVVPLLAACGGAPAQATPTPTDPNIVYPGEIGYQLNPQYTPDGTAPMFVESGFVDPGGKLDLTIQKKDVVAEVGDDQVGIYMRTIYKPGKYPRIPKFAMKIEKAAFVPKEFIGIYKQDGETYQYLVPGYAPYRETDVVLVPVSLLRYRTVDAPLLESGKGCSAPYPFLCETSLTDMKVGNGVITATVDVDMIFKFNIEPKDQAAPQLYSMASITNTISTMLITPLRGSRAISAQFSIEGMESGADWPGLEKAFLDMLSAKAKGSPVSVVSVTVRRVTVGDREWRQTRQSQLQQQEAAKQEAVLAGIRQANQAKLQEIEASQRQFERDQDQKDFEVRLARLKSLIESVGNNPELLKVVLQSGTLPVDSNPTVTPTPAP